jgi:hypothetical protein
MLAKKDPRRINNLDDPVSLSLDDLATGFWNSSELGGTPPSVSGKNADVAEAPKDALRLSDSYLEDVAFLARAVAFRINGNRPLQQACLLEVRNKPTALHGPLSQVMDYCIGNRSARDAVASYLGKVLDEKLDQYESKSPSQYLLQRLGDEALPEAIEDFMNAATFNDFFPIPEVVAQSMRELATNAAELIADHPAFAARVAPAASTPSAEEVARHLVQILLTSQYIWSWVYVKFPLREHYRTVHGVGLGEAGAPSSIRGSTVLAVDSVSQYWNCHLAQHLLSKVGRPEVVPVFSKVLAETTVVPHYFKKDWWKESHSTIITILDDHHQTLEAMKMGLCPIFSSQSFYRSSFSLLEKELAPRARVEGTTSRAKEFPLEGSPLGVLRYSTDPLEPALYSLKWISDKYYALNISRGFETARDDLEMASFLVSTAGNTVRFFGLGKANTCRLDAADSRVIVGEPPTALPITTSLSLLFDQLQDDLHAIHRFDPAAFSQLRYFPADSALEVVDDGFVLRFPGAAFDDIVNLFAGRPEVKEALNNLAPFDDSLRAIHFCRYESESASSPEELQAAESDSVPAVSSQSLSYNDERRQVTRLLHRRSFKFGDFFTFMAKHWGVGISQGAKHLHITRNGHHYPTGKPMRDPRDSLSIDMAFKIFKCLDIPLSEVAVKLREE